MEVIQYRPLGSKQLYIIKNENSLIIGNSRGLSHA